VKRSIPASPYLVFFFTIVWDLPPSGLDRRARSSFFRHRGGDPVHAFFPPTNPGSRHPPADRKPFFKPLLRRSLPLPIFFLTSAHDLPFLFAVFFTCKEGDRNCSGFAGAEDALPPSPYLFLREIWSCFSISFLFSEETASWMPFPVSPAPSLRTHGRFPGFLL